ARNGPQRTRRSAERVQRGRAGQTGRITEGSCAAGMPAPRVAPPCPGRAPRADASPAPPEAPGRPSPPRVVAPQELLLVRHVLVGPAGYRGPHLADQPHHKSEVVQGEQGLPEKLTSLEQVVQVGPGVLARDLGRPLHIERRMVVPKLGPGDVDPPVE